MKNSRKEILLFGLLLFSVLFILSACGEGVFEDVEENVSEEESGIAVGTRSIFIVKESIIAEGDTDCPNGGVLIERGIDLNEDGVLDSSEANVTEKVCE